MSRPDWMNGCPVSLTGIHVYERHKWLGHFSLYDADGGFIAGGFSEKEADLICKAMTLHGAAARAFAISRGRAHE